MRKCVCGDDKELKWDGELDPGKWAGAVFCFICMVALTNYFLINQQCLSVTLWPLATEINPPKVVVEFLSFFFLKISQFYTSVMHVIVCARACLAHGASACVCMCVCVGTSAGVRPALLKGERLLVSEGWASLSHGLWALSGPCSHLVIG